MKKFLSVFLSITIIFYSLAFAADVPRQNINDASFSAGQVGSNTQTAYETDHFVTTVTDANGNVIAEGIFRQDYDNNNGNGQWGYQGGHTPESVVANMTDTNGNPLSQEEQQKILDNLNSSGGSIQFDPRFNVVTADPNGDVTKNTKDGGTKNFSVTDSGLTAEEITNMGIPWTDATQQSFWDQYFQMDVEAKSEDKKDGGGGGGGGGNDDGGGDDGGGEDPTPTEDDGGDEEPEHVCNIISGSEPCDPHGGDGGSPATTDDVAFSANINSTEEYRKTHPYMLGSKFTISGNGHIDGDVYTPSEIIYWACGGYWFEYCDGCGAGGSWVCGASGSYTQYYPDSATYTDTYHNVRISFKGFEVSGNNYINLSKTVSNIGAKPYRDSSFSEEYIITKYIDNELKEDAASGLLYGTASVSCTCGCASESYKIYFDLTPINPPSFSAAFDLTVVADPNEGGFVRIGSSGEYLSSDTEEFELDSTFTIYAKANYGYKFDGWYDINGKKYSEKLVFSTTMPAYNLKLIAKFVTDDRYNITVYSDGNGYVGFSDSEEVGKKISANVLKGSDKTINSLPNEEFTLDYWERVKVTNDGDEEDVISQNLGSDEELLIEDIKEDYVIIAHFKPIHPYAEYKELVTESIGPGYVMGGTKYAVVGEHYPIFAFTSDDSKFNKWVDNIGDNNDNFGQFDKVIMPDGVDPYVLTAYFYEDGVNDEIDEVYQLEVKSDGNGKVKIDDGKLELEDAVTTDSNTPHTLFAEPSEGFEFSHWSDIDGNIVSNEIEWKDITVSKDELYIANFIPIDPEGTFSIIVSSAGGGDVTGNIDNAIPGEKYPIGAYPDDDYEFLYWKDKVTGEITEYSKEDLIIMPEKDLELVAYFREIDDGGGDDPGPGNKKYDLVVEAGEGGSATGSGRYPPEEKVWIEATPDSGYVFVGWYDENNQLISTNLGIYISMPYCDLTLKAIFRKSEEYIESSFKILSIRDIRWKDYFAGGGNISSNYLYIPQDAGKNDVLVNIADLIDNSFDRYRDVNYGYAVEFELITAGIYEADSTLVITPTIYKRSNSGNLTELDVDLGDYSKITSVNSKSREMFMITSSEEIVKISDSPLINNPIVNWNWVYYLPLDIYEDIYDESDGNDIVIKFDIKVKTKGGAEFDYVKVINYMYTVNSSYENRSNWGGNVFTYNMQETLLDDIYDNATN